MCWWNFSCLIQLLQIRRFSTRLHRRLAGHGNCQVWSWCQIGIRKVQLGEDAVHALTLSVFLLLLSLLLPFLSLSVSPERQKVRLFNCVLWTLLGPPLLKRKKCDKTVVLLSFEFFFLKQRRETQITKSANSRSTLERREHAGFSRARLSRGREAFVSSRFRSLLLY